MYYKLGQPCFITTWQMLLQIGAAYLFQNGAGVITNWGSYYKFRQVLLQIEVAITNWGKLYYKSGQLLQIGAIITNWGITSVFREIVDLGRRTLVI